MINSVLASIPSYFVTCFLWPKESIAKLESLLRAFFWQGKATVKGGQCLVAWDYVTLPKESGGLGVRDLSAHNSAMLCKFVAKILQQSDIPCFQWFEVQYCKQQLFSGAHHRDTPLWKNFKQFIPFITAASHCALGA